MSALTPYGWLVILWITAIPFQYGYHISVLNQLHSVMSCEHAHVLHHLPTCFESLDDFTFSVVTSVFNLGGLLGSSQASDLMERLGRKGSARISSFLIALGSALMSFSGSVAALAIGRFLVGIGCGIGICLAPLYLNEVAPRNIASTVGVLTQMGIVIGIFLTQLLGVFFTSSNSGPNPSNSWRIVLFFSFAISLTQFFGTSVMIESPRFLRSQSLRAAEDARSIERRIWSERESDSVESPLLDERDPEAHPSVPHNASSPLRVSQVLFKTPTNVRIPLVIISCAMVGQQFSGINAVLYYSNDILSQALPESGKYKLGRKPLLFLSVAGAVTSLIILGLGLDFAGASGSQGPTAWTTVSSVFIVFFVMSFAIGLGPVPFVMIPEISPFHAVSALSTIALTLNWLTNFSVSLLFLPLRNALSGGPPNSPNHDPGKVGHVFWIFAAVLTLVMGIVWSKWKT
ncbi:hypothetical protein D9757_001669 [Collybiopsis confluens]|uniref:Major facilitator superfamily (MFS) profile domain-containing protein n=1 Tax=Collybiopsis confluens TaxID=2823264 RepID=A0A8H5MF62_9AGAR|nr:hypothetical protein D9757_001669 [Collybiopsis confluens]